ncbi:MAG: hypothetical protein ACOX0X_01855 [Candidatus Dojkabacteria bacterium]|jgi:type IV secretory pathway VirB2 component (pilin)
MDLSGIYTVSSYENLSAFVIGMVNWFINFAVVLTIIMIIVAGFQYMTSMGDEKKISAANRSLIFSLIGMILVFLAPSVIQFVIDNFLSK